jgi:hypothetical protein
MSGEERQDNREDVPPSEPADAGEEAPSPDV